MAFPIHLFVGLGNPGAQYADTRHNAGAWLIERLAEQQSIHLRFENKFHGFIAEGCLKEHAFWLLIPTTFMNESGRSVSAVAKFYKISPQAILIAHDELDFHTGTIRIKKEGGHGGHNGLQSVIDHLHTRDFFRMRIGIGHPGNRQDVINYVLSNPSRADKQQIMAAIDEGLRVLPELLIGNIDRATRELHGK